MARDVSTLLRTIEYDQARPRPLRLLRIGRSPSCGRWRDTSEKLGDGWVQVGRGEPGDGFGTRGRIVTRGLD